MPTEWIQVLVQIPLVAAFIWYTLELWRRNSELEGQRDDAWRCFMREQQSYWQSFIDTQNQVMIAGLSDVTNEMSHVEHRLETLSDLLVRHNGMVRGMDDKKDNEDHA